MVISHQTGMLARGLLDPAVDVFGHERVDLIADAQHDHASRGSRGCIALLWPCAGRQPRTQL